MASPAKLNYKIYQGSTFQEVYRWESETKIYQSITGVSKSAPCTITTEGIPELPVGWRFRVVGAGGMKEINNTSDSWYVATAVDTLSNSIEINSVNSTGYSSYTSGGVVEFNTPVPLVGYTATMQIRPEVGSDILIYSTNSTNGTIHIDTTNSTINVTIPASITGNFSFSTAVYAIELSTTDGLVIPFISGNMTLVPEIVK